MFDFTLAAFIKDMVVFVACFAVLLALMLLALAVLYKREQPAGISYKKYAQEAFTRPFWRYGYLGLGLFFAIYASRLVVVKMGLALFYAWLMLLVFKPKDPV